MKPFGDGWVENFGDGADVLRFVDGHGNRLTQILIAFDMRRNADVVQHGCDFENQIEVGRRLDSALRGVLASDAAQPLDKDVPRDWFQCEIIGRKGGCLSDDRCAGVGSQNNDGRACAAHFFVDPADETKPVQIRENEFGDDDVRPRGENLTNGFGAVAAGSDDFKILFLFQNGAEECAKIAVAVHQE